jgi:hypothetical protein
MPNWIRSLRELFQSVAFAGLESKPPASKLDARGESLSRTVERPLGGPRAPAYAPRRFSRRGLAGAAALLGILAAIAVYATYVRNPSGQADRLPMAQPVLAGEPAEFELSEATFREGVLLGKIRSKSSRTWPRVDVSLLIYDESGRSLGHTTATVLAVAPGSLREFKVAGLHPAAAIAQVDEITPLE